MKIVKKTEDNKLFLYMYIMSLPQIKSLHIWPLTYNPLTPIFEQVTVIE